jgi:hypothetical protein
MTRIRTIAAISTLTLVLVACGGLKDEGKNGGGSGGGIAHPTGSDQLVLRWEYQGGFVAPEYTLTRPPSWSLYGDGRLVTEGPMIEIYPGPALPNLLVTRITEDGIQAILQAAKDAGLMNGDASYPYPCVADAPDTVFTTNAGGTTSVVSATALGDAGGGACPNVDTAARKDLADFLAKLGDLASFLPSGSVGTEESYASSEIRIYAMPYDGQPDVPQEPVAWPLTTPLDSFGDPQQVGIQDARCGVVTGADLEALMPLLQQANQLTPWTSGGARYRLVVRPLLPDEHGC